MSDPLFPTPTFTPVRWLAVGLVLAAGIACFFLYGLHAEPIIRVVGTEVSR